MRRMSADRLRALKVLLLSGAMALPLFSATVASAQEICNPANPECGTGPAPSSAPRLTVQEASVTVDEGSVASADGTFDDAFDADADETVALSASRGTVQIEGAESGAWDWRWPTDRLGAIRPAGEHRETVEVTATDSTGRSSSVSFEVTVRPVPPVVDLTKPGVDAFARGTATLSAEASDNVAVSHVAFYADGDYLSSDFEAPYELAWDTTKADDGPVVLTAEARDRMGNVSTTPERSVTVDNTSPGTPNLYSPAERARTTAAFSVRGSAEAGTTVELFEGEAFLGEAKAGRFSRFNIPLEDIPEGPHAFRAVSTDGAGNASVASAARRVVVDATRPRIIGVAPPPGARGVAVGSAVAARFSEAIRPNGLDHGAFSLRKAGSDETVGATLAYDPTRRRAILRPVRDLARAATYVATVRGGSSGVKDPAGNALSRDKTWTFRTER